MILSSGLSQTTHYEIIGIKEDASHDEVRKTYRSAILNYHPDKHQTTRESSKPEQESRNRFLELQRAWEILSDPTSRALYDNELRTLRQDAVTAEDVSLEDLSIEDAEDCLELSYPCRCGDFFSVNCSELEEMGCRLSRNGGKISVQTPGSVGVSVILPCGSCSLKVRLLLDANTSSET